ncbi:DUF192 domain-containing protein [Agarivorans sp. MS3-6]|uniref:DUF192 domain-containing protein n=1 Tax=Agarivorans sp. TSD2052 TaxID=2937286 RepID=UPI00200DE5D0|nr:DUF192 domain-containing protein [Agarivorans sp. TSD2052]UPW19033.1 DUF192 domain-containing protein [Agarivorans sp. TSD2052]
MKCKRVQGMFILVLLLINSACATQPFAHVEVSVHQRTYQLEYALDQQQRAKGLMHRRSLCENCGMLFNFQQSKKAKLWMKDTFIPLDVAFIRKDGTIMEIRAMQPHDTRLTQASQNILYAWEMQQTWFDKNAIKVGDIVNIKLLE